MTDASFTSIQQKLMEVNYLGSVYPTRAVITTMKERRMGRIMFVSSQAGQIGLFGYTAYSPSKFALRGLAESLQMEVSTWTGTRGQMGPLRGDMGRSCCQTRHHHVPEVLCCFSTATHVLQLKCGVFHRRVTLQKFVVTVLPDHLLCVLSVKHQEHVSVSLLALATGVAASFSNRCHC